MPDHFHVLITVKDISIERAVQLIKGGFAFRAGNELGFRPPVWERGFSETRVNDPDAAAQISEYIVQNPVRRGFVSNPADYPYCSAHPGFVLDGLPQGLKPRLNWAAVGTPEGVPHTNRRVQAPVLHPAFGAPNAPTGWCQMQSGHLELELPHSKEATGLNGPSLLMYMYG